MSCYCNYYYDDINEITLHFDWVDVNWYMRTSENVSRLYFPKIFIVSDSFVHIDVLVVLKQN